MTLSIKPRGRGPAVLVVLAVVMAVVGPIVSFLHLDHLRVRTCMFKTITGIPCMTCGSTRALGRLAHLDFMGGLRVNPLATVTLLTLFVAGVVNMTLLPSGRTLRLDASSREWRWMIVSGLVLLFVNWIYLIATGV